MFVDIPLEKSYRLINHGPIVLVTTQFEGKSNIAPVAWTTPVNDEPPLVGVPLAESHYTTELIHRSGTFVINIPGEDLLPAIMHTGRSSGRNEDKFHIAGLSPADGIKIPVPHIEQSLGFLECRVRQKQSLDGVILFIADVLCAQAREEFFDDSWITEKAKTIHHLGGGHFALIGKRFKFK